MPAYPYYPPYSPYGSVYSPTYQPVTAPPAQMQQTQMPVTNQGSTASGIIWVSGINEAQMYPVAPNSAVALWEQSGKCIYLKSADSTGKPSIRVYDLVERTEAASSAAGAPGEKAPDYATKDDLAEIASAVRGVLGDIDQIKADMYGIAGKKKPAKKEVAEDDA